MAESSCCGWGGKGPKTAADYMYDSDSPRRPNPPPAFHGAPPNPGAMVSMAQHGGPQNPGAMVSMAQHGGPQNPGAIVSMAQHGGPQNPAAMAAMGHHGASPYPGAAPGPYGAAMPQHPGGMAMTPYKAPYADTTSFSGPRDRSNEPNYSVRAISPEHDGSHEAFQTVMGHAGQYSQDPYARVNTLRTGRM
ncbi:circumsporozoite protein-like [Belonocnema kinseyi]|uniref:circumsporozoite protein-like n=1 Tax=Belonocnema kinseyi TaxID=2817044 RepID=UPI00143CD601|nr:circumsporozoite protein-like [Belonocnema kinseyi]